MAVYRVTEFFPEKEPLRFQIREVANRILANLILANPHSENIGNKGELLKDIKIIGGYFDLADAQNWLDPRNFLVLRKEYDKIKKMADDTSIESLLSNTGKVVENSFPNNGPNNHRQDKILEVIGENKGVKTGDIVKFLPEVNRRTVLRDLDKLCRAGATIRSGNGRGIYYTKNGHKHDMS